MRLEIAAVGIALCVSMVSIASEMDDINARIRARNAELQGQAPQKVKIDPGNSAGGGMTTEQANEYYRNIRRGDGSAGAQSQQSGAVGGYASDASQSPECKAALRDYDIESKSIARTKERIAAKRAAVSSQCQLELPADGGAKPARTQMPPPGKIVTDSAGRTYTTIGGGLAVPTSGGAQPCPIAGSVVVCP